MRTDVLRQLVRESLYVVDEAAVAEAIIVRANARRVVPTLWWGGDHARPRVRSFHRSRDARSFRLSGGGSFARR